MDRKILRNTLRERRRSLSLEEQSRTGNGVLTVLQSLSVFNTSQHIAVYLGSDGEVSPEQVVEFIWQRGSYCYLPVLDAHNPEAMYFQHYNPETLLKPNRYHILEPVLDLSRCTAAEALDLVLMPLTGFDASGGRLGMGGGFYDRTFSFVKLDSKPVLIGLAHECQKVDKVPVEEWDVAMTGVVTGERFY